MSDKIKNIDHERLISLYLSGEASDSEVILLENWVLEAPKNRKLFVQSKQAYHLSLSGANQAFDVDKAWNKVSQDLVSVNDDQKDEKVIDIRRGRRRLFSIAAAAAVILAAALWWYSDFGGTGVEYFESESMVLVDELPDGSIISLNRNSKISFEQKQNRSVKLHGDAYFEVKRDEQSPFIVEADDIQIRVLGTSFYVNAKSDKPNIEVMVSSGRVAVRYMQDSLILTRGQSAIFNKANKSLIQTTIEDINYLSWKTKTLTFDDMDLGQVLRKINEVYDAEIILQNEQLQNCKITVTFKQQELDAILSIISEQFDLTLSKNGSKITLKGPACN